MKTTQGTRSARAVGDLSCSHLLTQNQMRLVYSQTRYNRQAVSLGRKKKNGVLRVGGVLHASKRQLQFGLTEEDGQA
jgi:hypothetical protein